MNLIKQEDNLDDLISFQYENIICSCGWIKEEIRSFGVLSNNSFSYVCRNPDCNDIPF